MLTSLFPLLYGLVVLFLLWQAVKVMGKGFLFHSQSNSNERKSKDPRDDRTGRLTIHPELLDKEGRITNEELLTVRFSDDNDPPHSAETSAE